jgi:hypothetical protein
MTDETKEAASRLAQYEAEYAEAAMAAENGRFGVRESTAIREHVAAQDKRIAELEKEAFISDARAQQRDTAEREREAAHDRADGYRRETVATLVKCKELEKEREELKGWQDVAITEHLKAREYLATCLPDADSHGSLAYPIFLVTQELIKLRKRIESAPKVWLYRIHGQLFARNTQQGPPGPSVITDMCLVHAVPVEENKCSLCGMTEKEHADDLCAAIYSLRSRGIEHEG